MKWIKQIIVDLIALIIIGVTVFFYEQTALVYAVYVYTMLMALARLFSLFSGNLRAITERKSSEAPLWVYHLIYAATSATLLFGQWYITGASWLFIWGAAIISHRK